MGKSKNNWDFLVDSNGNYRNLTEGEKGEAGSKGDPGEKGVSPVLFRFVGEVDVYASLPAADPGTGGDVYKVLDEDAYYASDGNGNYTSLPGINNIAGNSGQKGEVGQKGEKVKGDKGLKGDKLEFSDLTSGEKEELKGDKGDKGEEKKGEPGVSSPVFRYMGEVDNPGLLPGNASPGDVYKDISTGAFYAYGDDGAWSILPGVTALKGDKGQKGVKGVKGDKGEKVKGDKGFKGDKGEKVKGDKGQKGLDPDTSDFVTGGQLAAELDIYYDKTEVDNKLTLYVTKGQIEEELDKYYDKGEVDTLLGGYYTKGETYDKNQIDYADDNRYTKGEVDALLLANKGTTYTLSTVSAGPTSNKADIVLTNDNDSSTQNIPISVNGELGLSVVGGEIQIGGSFSQPLSYLGVISPPTDPSSEVADPSDGSFFIYDTSGTAWNDEEVLAGYWVIFDDTQSWRNVLIGVDSGVTSLGVSGGILKLEGSLTDPIVNLDKVELESSLNDRYLRLDGTNTYGAELLIGSETGLVVRNDDYVALDAGGANRVKVEPLVTRIYNNVQVENSRSLAFTGGSGAKLELPETEWGSLTSGSTTQIQWGAEGVQMHVDVDMKDNTITNLADPSSDQQAATKKYVDDNSGGGPLVEASATVLGGVKIGENINVTVDGTISVPTTKGEKGPKGDKLKGEKGQKGLKGEKGPKGIKGKTGEGTPGKDGESVGARFSNNNGVLYATF